MSGSVTVVGGVYAERCVRPGWDRVHGSGGRAAVAMSGDVGAVTLVTSASESSLRGFAPLAALNGVTLEVASAPRTISFDYLHTMAVPDIRPSLSRLDRLGEFRFDAECVLRFGMPEATAVVRARRCVHDPRSAFAPEDFRANGSTAEALTIVADRTEVTTLTGNVDPLLGADPTAVRTGKFPRVTL